MPDDPATDLADLRARLAHGRQLYAALRAELREAQAERDRLAWLLRETEAVLDPEPPALKEARARIGYLAQALADSQRAYMKQAEDLREARALAQPRRLQEAQDRVCELDARWEQAERKRKTAEEAASELRFALMDAHIENARLRMCLIQREMAATRPAGLPRDLLQALKALRTAAHPDRWLQGQPASALAHEVSVELNALLERWT